ncbi:MAG: replicative DNA helicase [Firmicutes bacterium]|nr:replicative DNA helicase [Bacillota bacterium]
MFDPNDIPNEPHNEASPIPVPRIPPNDQEAELAVLASMLFDRDAIAIAYEVLRGEDFYRPDNQIIYETMVELFVRSIPVDIVTLSNKLLEKGVLEQIGGRDRITDLAAAYYTSANIKRHAEIVAEKSLLRQLIKSANYIANAGYEAREDVAAILERAEKSVFDISQRSNVGDFEHISDVLIAANQRLEELFENQGSITGIETGFVDFDRRTAGLQPAELIILGARPSMGKTAILLNIAAHAAIRKGVSTAFFSLEMANAQLVNRIFSSEAGVDAQRLRTGQLIDEDWNRIAESIPAMSNAPIYLDDTPGLSVTELRSKCRRLKMEKGLGLIIIDYLQLMSAAATARPESRQQEISEISRSLKAIAKELNVPVLVAAQLSRAVESRSDKRPMMSDLRESGAIEQDADVIAFLYRDEYYNPETLKKGEAEVIISKQRNGPIGTVELMYLGHLTRFVNKERDRGSGI